VTRFFFLLFLALALSLTSAHAEAPEFAPSGSGEVDYDRLAESTVTCMDTLMVTNALGHVIGDCWDICTGVVALPPLHAAQIRQSCHEQILRHCHADVACVGQPIPVDPSTGPTPFVTPVAD
jgi:hypothetical protein